MAKRGPLKGTDTAPSHVKPLRHIVLDAMRRLLPDPLPLEPPVGYKRSPPLAEQIRAMVRGEALAHAARTSGKETFEEADDFEVDDDFDPQSPYEETFEPLPSWEDQQAALGEHFARGQERYKKKLEEAAARRKKKQPVKKAEVKKSDVVEGEEEGGA